MRGEKNIIEMANGYFKVRIKKDGKEHIKHFQYSQDAIKWRDETRAELGMPDLAEAKRINEENFMKAKEIEDYIAESERAYPGYRLPFPPRKFDCLTYIGRVYMRLTTNSHSELLKMLDWHPEEIGYFVSKRNAVQLILHRMIIAQGVLDESHEEYHNVGLENPQAQHTNQSQETLL